MTTRHWAGWVVVGVIGAAGCTGRVDEGSGGSAGSGATSTSSSSVPTGSGSSSTTTATTSSGTPLSCPPPEPKNHRPSAEACFSSIPTQACTTDADCTALPPATAGKCTGGFCDDTPCYTDADCASAGAVCSCEGQSWAGGSNAVREDLPGGCSSGNCRVDADCGAGFYCSPSFASACPSSELTGFYCHTCADACADDSDCNALEAVCAFDSSAKHWACFESPCGV